MASGNRWVSRPRKMACGETPIFDMAHPRVRPPSRQIQSEFRLTFGHRTPAPYAKELNHHDPVRAAITVFAP